MFLYFLYSIVFNLYGIFIDNLVYSCPGTADEI